MTSRGIERTVVELLEARHPKTACPSEAARAIDAEHWREYMRPVRDAAARLAKRGRIDVLQRGKKVDPKTAHGPASCDVSWTRRRHVLRPSFTAFGERLKPTRAIRERALRGSAQRALTA